MEMEMELVEKTLRLLAEIQSLWSDKKLVLILEVIEDKDYKFFSSFGFCPHCVAEKAVDAFENGNYTPSFSTDFPKLH